ncbi:MAG TPA: protoporphyrinogen oxidase [Aquifex aeolicus]|nr:protoporphyrinogen oxidase [Aquifex aeolicus]
MREVVIVGSGISGLSVAYRLKKKDIDVVVYEKDDYIGGTIKTVIQNGYLMEMGPQTLLANEEVLNFLKEIGLKPVEASPWAKYRFIYKRRKLISLPLSPREFLMSPLLSLTSKLKVFLEYFKKGVEDDIPIADFVRNHFGDEFLNYIVSPFLSGVYAGDPEKLSLKYATPKLYEVQRKYGSLIKAFLKEKRFTPRGKLVSFEEGMSELPKKLAQYLEVHTENVVLRMRKHEDRFKLDVRGKKIESKSVVVASPAYTSSYLLKEISFSASEEFDRIDYPPVVVVNVGVVGDIPQGFGFLVPRVEGKRILGAMFMSKLFPGRAPQGKELLSVFLGGATDRDVIHLSDEEIIETVERELKEILNIKNLDYVKIERWKRAIPQYNVGYGKFLELSRDMEKDYPGLFLTGNWLHGVSMGDSIKASEKIAKKVEEFLRSQA